MNMNLELEETLQNAERIKALSDLLMSAAMDAGNTPDNRLSAATLDQTATLLYEYAVQVVDALEAAARHNTELVVPLKAQDVPRFEIIERLLHVLRGIGYLGDDLGAHNAARQFYQRWPLEALRAEQGRLEDLARTVHADRAS